MQHRATPDSSVKADFHVHTNRSPDATIPPRLLGEIAAEAGIDRVAVTDHDTMDGAFEALETAPDVVIPGQEISCRGGLHLIGLFLIEPIPRGLAVEAAAERIRDQGGIVYAPHAFAYLWLAGARGRRLLDVADVVEVLNSRSFLPWLDGRATREAARMDLPGVAGSDAHFHWELGRAWTFIPKFTGPKDFMRAVAGARPIRGRVGSPLLHLASAALKVSRRLHGGSSRPPGHPLGSTPSPSDEPFPQYP